MKSKELIKKAREFAEPFRITKGNKFRLKDVDPDDTLKLDSDDKPRAKEALQMGVELLAELQDMLYAQDKWGVLLIFQAMDAAGKDGAIKHVMSGVNPQGCQVSSFKAPSAEDLDHDYMWRCLKCLPERGRIGIFNRSYYEETLVVRVHPNLLAKQKIPPELIEKKVWKHRFEDINCFERYLTRNGIIVRKFFLHVSRGEQERRFLDRIDRPEKNWKFSASDAAEREHWDEYMDAYEDMIRNTATKDSPWYVVPADNKWFTRVVVAAAVIDALASLDLEYPKVSAEKLEELAAIKQQMLEKRSGGKKSKEKKSGEKKSGAKQTVAPKPAETKPVAETTPAAAKPVAPKPAAAKPVAPKPVAPKPAAAKPVAAKPAATKPAATKPAATKPAATKPGDGQPVATNPGGRQPDVP